MLLLTSPPTPTTSPGHLRRVRQSPLRCRHRSVPDRCTAGQVLGAGCLALEGTPPTTPTNLHCERGWRRPRAVVGRIDRPTGATGTTGVRGGGYALHDSREVTAEEQKWSLAWLGYLHCLTTVCLRSRSGSGLRPPTPTFFIIKLFMAMALETLRTLEPRRT